MHCNIAKFIHFCAQTQINKLPALQIQTARFYDFARFCIKFATKLFKIGDFILVILQNLCYTFDG